MLMSPEELKIQLANLSPSVTFEEGSEWLNAYIDNADWGRVAPLLKSTPGLEMDYLFCLTCVDWKTHLTMVYHLTSTLHRHTVVIKVKLDRNKAETETVSAIWRTAEFHEREVYELFGVNFLHHPDLRLLILPDGWEGKNPLRKDYEDPVNMIKL